MGEGEVAFQGFAAALAHGETQGGVGEEMKQGAGKSAGQVGGVHQESGNAVVNDLGNTAGAGADAGLGVLHGFQKNDAKTLLGAGQDEEVAGGIVGGQEGVRDRAGEKDPGGEAEAAGQVEERLALGAVADDDVKGVGHLAQDFGQGGDDGGDIFIALGRRQSGDGEQHRAGRQAESGAVQAGVAGAGVNRVEGVGEHAEAGGGHGVHTHHFALGVGADAEDAVEAGGAQSLQRGQGLPDLDAMGDQALEGAGHQRDQGEEIGVADDDDIHRAGGAAGGEGETRAAAAESAKVQAGGSKVRSCGGGAGFVEQGEDADAQVAGGG